MKAFSRALLRKPTEIFAREENEGQGLERNLSLFDLLCIGVGGTVGSGVFVLSGLIANKYSGPSVAISFLIAGISCLFSAASYGELSSRIPSAGSSYAYVYATLGEYLAVIAACCLTMEYGISGAAVARSWGDKLISWLQAFDSFDLWWIFNPGYQINVFAGLLQFACTLLLLVGIEVGKITVNIFTVFKVILILFMIVMGFSSFRVKNIMQPPPFGMQGIIRGSTPCFFGYVGYDEVCCMAAESKDPHKNLPRAVFGTIIAVTFFYCFASVALVGMQDYHDISSDSCFPDAFRSAGQNWAAHVVAVGELVALPIVVLVSFLAQPRLQFALAEDGLLPKLFCELNSKGNMVRGIWLSGLACTFVAVFVPFYYLDDMISASVLFSFNLTNSALVVVRRSANSGECKKYLVFFHILSIVSGGMIAKGQGTWLEVVVVSLIAALLVFLAVRLYLDCPERPDENSERQYRVPFVPFTPLIGVFINYLLLMQLSWLSLGLVILYFAAASVLYFSFGVSNDDVMGWKKEVEGTIELISSTVNVLPTSSSSSVSTSAIAVSSTSHSRLVKYDSLNCSDNEELNLSHRNTGPTRVVTFGADSQDDKIVLLRKLS